ncbi:DEAD/DEAH box helicase [Geoalkalibacter sp.]|uniref:DEAD/DEAH box helicase n=1 Tax=Geoalkalibacter sp. TaxID=3041440 RepID=UPI00272E7535|nr:DEAD/DEAH box helicase [Geoalkalibacter sp.]
MKFTELNLPAEVLQGIAQVGFTDLTPVQEESIPLALAGRDVTGQAQTGTGKTAAFLISLFTRMLRNPQETGSDPRALILAPTRELVAQICEDAKGLGAFCPFKVQPIFGGIDYQKQRDALRGGVDVIVATPGRLIDYAKQKVFSFARIEFLVIDEADRMFDMGFIRDLRFILRRLPPFEKRQTMLFSATLSHRVRELAYEFMNLAERVEVEPEQVTAERVEQILFHVSRREKFPLLLGLLAKESAATRVLIFVNTKREAEHLTERLRANEFRAAVISGDIPQQKRMRILAEFKSGQLRFLVATDVASRGIHVDDVTHVINYDLPQDPEDYVHRIGRTARAGALGKAISLADEDLVLHLDDIEAYISRRIPSAVPGEDDFIWDYKRPHPRKKAPVPEKAAPSGERKRPARRRRAQRKPSDGGATST